MKKHKTNLIIETNCWRDKNQNLIIELPNFEESDKLKIQVVEEVENNETKTNRKSR